MTKNFALWLACLFLLCSCQIFAKIDTHQVEPVEVNRHDTLLDGWVFADLKGNEADYFIGMDTQQANLHSIYVADMQGKVISQINAQAKFRSVKVLPDGRDNSRWMFYSYNNGSTVFLDAVKYNWQIPLQRESKRFQSIPRNDTYMDNKQIEYYGQIIPEILDDLDGDGRTELLCRAIDSFTANPRGLVLYDFDSGSIKWRFDTPSNLNSVLWEDFNGDGKKELIASNYAFKNTSAIINGMDDASGWIMVLSTRGELLYKQQQFKGYGQVSLFAADANQDGNSEIYAVNCTWGSENNRNIAAIYNWNGSRLQSSNNLELSSTLERYQIPDFMQQMDGYGKYHLILVDKSKGLLVLDDQLRTITHRYKAYVKQIWDIGDLDGDGDKEILLQTDDDYLEILDKRFTRRARIKNPFPDENTFYFGIVKTGFESQPLISIGSGREVRYYQYKHLPLFHLIYNLYIGFSPYLVILILLLVLLILFLSKLRLKAPQLGVDYLSDGVIVMRNARQIRKLNRSAFAMAAKSDDPSCKDLKLCFPPIYNALQGFTTSKQEIHEVTLDLYPEGLAKICKVTIIRIHSLRGSYLIIFNALKGDDDGIREKIQWADIARRLSHHVRRHITNIILALDALQPVSECPHQDYYQIIKDEIEKVRVFTHAFQRFTELKDYDLKLQDIIPSMEHCLSRIRIPENIHVLKGWSLKSVHAYIEPIRFEEAITNMITNSIEAMPAGGNLHICVKEFPAATAPQSKLRVLVEIEDNGVGIPAKYMEEIWKPFFTTNQSGTGIGIPETRKIIDSMGGIMDIQSEEGVGTTISFWLKGGSDE